MLDKYEQAEKLQQLLDKAEDDLELRDIPGFEGRYAASASGKIWSYKNKRFLKDRDEKYGYRRISLRQNGSDQLQTFMIHRLVALAWVPNPDNLPQINHKDEDKTNNHYTNLEWCDIKYNINYGTRSERAGRARSRAVRCIETGEVFPSIKAAGEWLNHTTGHSVNKCCLGQYKTSGGYHWEYAEPEAASF